MKISSSTVKMVFHGLAFVFFLFCFFWGGGVVFSRNRKIIYFRVQLGFKVIENYLTELRDIGNFITLSFFFFFFFFLFFFSFFFFPFFLECIENKVHHVNPFIKGYTSFDVVYLSRKLHQLQKCSLIDEFDMNDSFQYRQHLFVLIS